jgi:hypothetical protein
MATSTAPSLVKQQWSPARVYLVVSGVMLMFFAVAGFAVNRAFPIGAGQVEEAGTGHIFGLLETNGWHSLGGVVSAAVAFAFALKPQWSRTGALVKGVYYVVLTIVVGVWGGETFWIASNAADQVFHAAFGIGGVVTGLLSARSKIPDSKRLSQPSPSG